MALNPQGLASHEKFATKYRLPFPLAADPDKRVCKSYGAVGFLGMTRRALVLIDHVRYTRTVRPEDIAAFARRDWRAVAACKDAQWLEERRRRGIEWCFRVADDLRRQVAQQQPAWPTARDRQADIDTHVRVGEALRRVHRAGDH